MHKSLISYVCLVVTLNLHPLFLASPIKVKTSFVAFLYSDKNVRMWECEQNRNKNYFITHYSP